MRTYLAEVRRYTSAHFKNGHTANTARSPSPLAGEGVARGATDEGPRRKGFVCAAVIGEKSDQQGRKALANTQQRAFRRDPSSGRLRRPPSPARGEGR